MGFSKLPPSGNAVSITRLLFQNDTGFPARFAARNGFRADHSLFTGSGTAALYLALLGMKRMAPDRKQVAVPAWCCPSVAQAVLQADLQPVLVDLDPETFGYSRESLEKRVGKDTLAVLWVHFFGIRVPLPTLPAPPAFFLRDCAQDFHFRRDGNEDIPCFYSFGRGKSLNGGQGGALCLPPGSELLSICSGILETFPLAGSPLPKAALVNGLSHPLAFGALSRLPLGIGETRWEAPLHFSRIHPGFLKLAAPLLDALEENLPAYAALVAEYSRLPALSSGSAHSPAYAYPQGHAPIRFPILISDPDLRRRFMNGLNDRFGGVTGQYPDLLHRLAGAPANLGADGTYPGCERIARQIVTLPVTAWLRKPASAFIACAQRLISGAKP